MSTGSLDTLSIARKLKAAGFSEDQADAVTGVIPLPVESFGFFASLRHRERSEATQRRDSPAAERSPGSLRCARDDGAPGPNRSPGQCIIHDAREADLSTLATKVDLAATEVELRTEIAEAKYGIPKWVLSAIGFQTIVIVGAIVAPTKGLR